MLGLPLPVHRNTPSPIHTPPLLSSNSQQIVYLYNVRSTNEVGLFCRTQKICHAHFTVNLSGEAEPHAQWWVSKDGSVHIRAYEHLHCICCLDHSGNWLLQHSSKMIISSCPRDIFCQILLIVNQSYMSEYGIGIWTGLSYGISGIMGIFSANKTTTCT